MDSDLPPLEGVIPAIPTSLTSEGRVAHDKLTQNLERWNGHRLSGYLVLGSNGENVYLSQEEKIRILQTARKAIPAGKVLIAGTGCESTVETITLTRRAAEVGTEAALVVTPHFYGGQMTAGALVSHFFSVADASPIPILVYNVPKFTHLDLGAPTIARMAEHPNILGIKDSGGNVEKLGDVVRLTGDGFRVLTGAGGVFFPALVMGAVGGIMAVANVVPEQAIDVYDLFRKGDWEQAAELQRWLIPVNAAVTSRFAVAGLKAALDMLGYYGGPVRPPLLELQPDEREELRGILAAGGVFS
ncbi:MAG: dihydrodipicolinate synthase family protein [Acidobacteria bacterium]|nr:dihydrodipicolinate synthase family protein [Acidobacteriota bacterium]